jgi:hypothetical protein
MKFDVLATGEHAHAQVLRCKIHNFSKTSLMVPIILTTCLTASVRAIPNQPNVHHAGRKGHTLQAGMQPV